jgi:probable O-glycosylation ligase (exosortase A-associated)
VEKGLIFTYVLTYGGAFVSLVNPYVGLLIYILFSILKPEAMWYWSVPVGNYSRIVAIGLLIGWAVQGFGTWNVGKARAVIIAFVGYWLWAVFSSVNASDRDLGFTFVEEQAKILLPFLVGMTVIDSVARLKALAWTLVGSIGYVALEFNLAYYSGFNRVVIAGHAGMDNNCIAIAMVTGVGLALFMAMATPQWWQKGAAMLAALLMAHTVMFSNSRGGMLALIVTGMVGFLLIPKKPMHYLLFAVALAVCYRLAGKDVVERFTSSFADDAVRDSSAESRLVLWGNCIDIMLRYPVFGAGPQHFGLMAPQFGWPLGKEAHSLWFTLLAEMGVPGLAWLVAFYGLTIKRMLSFLSRKAVLPDPWFADVARMVIASLAGFIVAAQFVTIIGLETPYYVVLLGASALRIASTADSPAVEQGVEQDETADDALDAEDAYTGADAR